jgi:hypothetical protein
MKFFEESTKNTVPWIRIRIRIQWGPWIVDPYPDSLEMLYSDPDSLNPDLQL